VAQILDLDVAPRKVFREEQNEDELRKVAEAGERIQGAGMQFNAGHALNYLNVPYVARLSGVRELHIGHAIVSRAVFVGLAAVVREYLAVLGV